MIDTSTARFTGTALIVSEDALATRQLAETVCISVSDALDRVNHSKLAVAVIDFSLGNQAAYCNRSVDQPPIELQLPSQSRPIVLRLRKH